MNSEILPGFDFCVYSSGRERICLSTDGLWRVWTDRMWQFGMWIECPDGVKNLPQGTILVQYEHQVGWYPLRTEEERKEIGRTVASLFCTFLQGVTLGWSTIKYDVEVAGDRRSEINVATYIGAGDLSVIAKKLGVASSDLRRFCREDIVVFSMSIYEEKGSNESWNTTDFLDSGTARFPYGLQLIQDVLVDLSRENKLGVEDEGHYRLEPGCYDDRLVADTRAKVTQWLRQLRVFGQERNWMKTHESDTVRTGLRIFIIHGHDEAKRRELKDLLLAEFNLDAVVMQERAGQSRTLIEKFEEEASKCNAAIALITPDDCVRVAEHAYEQPRPNVIYELGWFAGKHGRNRTLMIVREGATIPSDLEGIERIQFSNQIAEQLLALRREINAWRPEP